MRGVRGVRAVFAVLVVLGGLSVRVETHDPVTNVTYAREVRAILQARCVSCHWHGGPAPMPLTSYEEVRPWARAIKDQVLARRMPKWSAAHGYGAFANDPSLTPAEVRLIAAWTDGGQPRGAAGRRDVPMAPSRPRLGPGAVRLEVPTGAAGATVRGASRWIAGWDFEPGDPLVTSATFTSGDGAAIGTWVAGDAAVHLPAGAAIRVVSPVRVDVQRRARTDYEKPAAAKPSVLRVLPRAAAQRRVWVERTACGAPRTGRPADLLAVRPILADGASARVWLERPGAPQAILGWFRDVESLYQRTFWLARAAELTPESRIAADAACALELTLVSR